MEKITSTYIRDLAVVYHNIDNRGLLFDERIMRKLDHEIKFAVDTLLDMLSANWHCPVYIGTADAKSKDTGSINLNSPTQLLDKLKRLGYDIPKVRKKNKDTYDFEYKESVEELVLRKIFAATSSIDIQSILEIRELNTLRSRYVNSKRVAGVFYSCYNTAGTITGRRGCKKHTFGVGGNGQTLPKHYNPQTPCYKYGQEFLSGVIARPGKIFFHVDQYSAEDWAITALSENHNGLLELQNRVDRHSNLASYIFGTPVCNIIALQRYLGKKSKYANSYGMRGQTMSDSLTKEGYAFTSEYCQSILDKVDSYDPSLEQVFHKYIRDTIYATNMLQTPFGRERHFHGLRQNDTNYKIFNEAYSYIPQSTVADNTGFAVYNIEQECSDIINECHDSVTQEIFNDLPAILSAYGRTRRAFDRDITFHNGVIVNIPIEGEIGFNMKDTVKIKPFTEERVRNAIQELNDTYRRITPHEQSTTKVLAKGL